METEIIKNLMEGKRIVTFYKKTKEMLFFQYFPHNHNTHLLTNSLFFLLSAQQMITRTRPDRLRSFLLHLFSIFVLKSNNNLIFNKIKMSKIRKGEMDLKF